MVTVLCSEVIGVFLRVPATGEYFPEMYMNQRRLEKGIYIFQLLHSCMETMRLFH